MSDAGKKIEKTVGIITAVIGLVKLVADLFSNKKECKKPRKEKDLPTNQHPLD